MRLRYWGDSYDLVKQSLLRWLSPFGEWSVHPMFTEEVGVSSAELFAAFIGARLVSCAVLAPGTNRRDYFFSARTCGNLFLDPDTGVRAAPIRGKQAPQFLLLSELVDLAKARPGHLSMVFDQSHPRGGTRKSLEAKLQSLAENGVRAFAYESHASFIISSCEAGAVGEARERILRDSRLPAARLVSLEG